MITSKFKYFDYILLFFDAIYPWSRSLSVHRGTAPKSMKSLVGTPFKPKYVTLSGKSGSCLDPSTTTLIFHLLPAVVENISFRYEMINRKKKPKA